MHIYLVIIIVFLIGGYLLEALAQYLNLNHLASELPEEFSDTYDAKEYRKSQDYTRAKTRLEIISSSVNLVILLAFIFLGGFPWLDGLVRSLGWTEAWTGIVFIGLLALAQDLISLPFEIYNNFGLEERFGFNRMGWKTFLSDKLKEYFLLALIGIPLLFWILLFFGKFPHLGWLYAWGVIIVIMLAIQYVAPTWILPLFNKFTPLEDGELKNKITNYIQKTGFKLKGIFVMDGSKRSTKSNAFFTGFGKKKRIALFDTLINKHEPNELVAVLAHEIGHYKLKHNLKNLFIAIVKLGIVLYLMSIFITHPPLFQAFGMEHMSVYAGLIFFALLYTPVSLIMSVIFNHLSRKYEFQADSFSAKSTEQPQDLISALKKLSADNLSNLTPHPLYVFLEYSHPPVLDRIKNLRYLENS